MDSILQLHMRVLCALTQPAMWPSKPKYGWSSAWPSEAKAPLFRSKSGGEGGVKEREQRHNIDNFGDRQTGSL